MAGSGDFSTLEGIMQMFSPSDLGGTQAINLGGPLEKIGDNSNPFKLLLSILENSGRGVYNIDDIESKIAQIKTKEDFGNVDLSKYLTIWTTKKVLDIGPETNKHKIAVGSDGSPQNLSSLVEVIGPDFAIPAESVASVILSRSPFFNPATRNTKKVELFMNSMPGVVLSQMVPYLQVEFQFTRDPSIQLQTAGQLKFLLGAADTSKFTGANKALVEAHTKQMKDNSGEFDFMGMEAFTSPQTLTNPTPNSSVGAAPSNTRFTEVIDPFRPFATLEHVTISVNPAGAGYFTYKKANMSIKVHDRSRLAEISDLIRPRVYTGVTIWLTYGWRAPVRGTDNPYFKYINDNLMMREAYHIQNSNFSFDQQGQVTINLEMFTKGVSELRTLKITDTKQDAAFRFAELKRLVEKISLYRQKLKLDPPESFSKELRVFQILDAAETGAFPDMKTTDIVGKIDALQKALDRTPGIDKDALNGLVSSMKELYKAKDNKFVLQEQYDKRVSSTVATMFKEVRTGPDPFLPSEGKGLGPDITAIIKKMNPPPATAVDKAQNTAVSFGKLFSVFALRSIMSMPETIDETQVFFYNLNESCGPISGHSIAEFPIDMNQFIDQFNDLVKARGGEKITLEDFLGLCINSQFLDNRAIGYGLTQYYQPYKKGKEAELKTGKDVEQNFENRLASYSSQWGPFKKPVVEMHIECSHERVSDAGENDVLQALAYSAANNSTLSNTDISGKSSRRILRIHVYDKQTNAHKEASKLFKVHVTTGQDGYFSKPSTDYAAELSKNGTDIISLVKSAATLIADEAGKLKITEFTNAQQAKYLVGQLMPTIRFGANGTTITSANLASKANPLLSSVQMMRTQTLKNTAGPNGSGFAGIPLRVIPASLQMTSLGNPMASAAQKYFIDFQTGTTLDNLYILTNYVHTFSPGKFETQWTFGFADGYGIFEGAPDLVDQVSKINPSV